MAMKKGFCVLQIGWEYTDEHFRRPDCDGGTPIAVYSNARQAHVAMQKMNAAKVKENKDSDEGPMQDSDGHDITKFYEVVEVDVEE